MTHKLTHRFLSVLKFISNLNLFALLEDKHAQRKDKQRGNTQIIHISNGCVKCVDGFHSASDTTPTCFIIIDIMVWINTQNELSTEIRAFQM